MNTEVLRGVHALFYPFDGFEERWLKIAALYWPGLIRLMPEDLPIGETETSHTLVQELGFLIRQNPTESVNSIADGFAQFIVENAAVLRERYGFSDEARRELSPSGTGRQRFLHIDPHGLFETTGVMHTGKVSPVVRDVLLEQGLAVWPLRPLAGLYSAPDGRPLMRTLGGGFASPDAPDVDHGPDSTWIAVPDDLNFLYSNLVAHDFATANKLSLVTAHPLAHTYMQRWSWAQIASALLDEVSRARRASRTLSIQTVGLLALDLVVPGNLDRVPVGRIVEIRRRYESEFFAFVAEVEQITRELNEALIGVRDESVLDLYLRDIVTTRLVRPARELRAIIRGLKLDTSTVALNIKAELPAGTVIAGGAYMLDRPVVAAAGAVALGLLALRRGLNEQQRTARQAAPAASFLMHVQDAVDGQGLLQQMISRMRSVKPAQ